MPAVVLTDAEAIKRYGVDAIRLPREDGTVHVPSFQFDNRGNLRNVVREINRMFGADEDPWGVADWWVTPNGVLWENVTPTDVIDEYPDHMVLHFAECEISREHY